MPVYEPEWQGVLDPYLQYLKLSERLFSCSADRVELRDVMLPS